MEVLPIPVRRAIYRAGYRMLQLMWLIRRPEMDGVKCVITDGERVLLVRHTYGHRRWDLPGGRVERDEPPVLAARREMQEELGVAIDDWVAIGEHRVSVDGRRDTLHCFRIELSAPQLTIDRGEIAKAAWFATGELPVNLAPYAREIISRASNQPRVCD